MQSPVPLTRDVVLMGGGHAHALVLKSWAMNPLAGARLTLIDPQPVAAYTGMLPGFVAGHYPRKSLEIDLVPLARFAGAAYVPARVTGVDPGQRLIHVEGRDPVAYDVASVNVGVTARMPDLPGFPEYGVPVRPLSIFADRWTRYLTELAADDTGSAINVIGAGVGGVELAMAMKHRLPSARIALLERGVALQGVPARTRDRLLRRLREMEILLFEDVTVAGVGPEEVTFADGAEWPSDFTVSASGAQPHDWLRDTGLPLERGFVVVGEDLSVPGHPELFAAGDCAHFASGPLPKAGVFAVRQAPVILNNIRARLGVGRMRPYRPQSDYLKLISLGAKEALLDRSGLALQGAPLWRWKNRIDRKFMEKLTNLKPMTGPDLPTERAEGVDAVIGEGQPLCGGCGAKVGRSALLPALARLRPSVRDDVESLPGDDAAVLNIGGKRLVLTTDHLRAFTEDPWTFARITAIHALGDVWAMGAAPQAVLLNVTLPAMNARLQDRTLAAILSAAGAVIAEAGAEIVGGHTTQGAELSLGLTVTGLLDGDPISLGGARDGDLLILTKPIGSGTILAAEMALKAPGQVLAACLDAMVQGQGEASRILDGAHAMTDVTGFGLAGHLFAMTEASGLRAELDLEAVPLMQGAEALARKGIASTLAPSNHESIEGAIRGLPQTARAALLFDPQTAGGLLAAVPQDVTPALRAAGYPAAVIGRIYDGPPGIEISRA